jgi:hypothetical protein
MKKPEDETPNQTIQVDGIEGLGDVELFDPEPVAPVRSSAAPRSVVPPPLPPGGGIPPPSARPSVAPARPSTAPAVPVAAPKERRTVLYGVLFFVMVAVAVGGGLTIGSALRGTTPPASASEPPSAAASPPGRPASDAASVAEPGVLTLPTIELDDVDASAGK